MQNQSSKHERNCKHKCMEENWKEERDVSELRRIQIRGTQTTLSTTMAWLGMWNNPQELCSDERIASHEGITVYPESSKITSVLSRDNPSNLSMCKKLMVPQTSHSRFKASRASRRKNNLKSRSSSTLSVTECSEASSDLIEVGEITEKLPVDDCIVRNIGVQSNLFATEFTQFHCKSEAKRNNPLGPRNTQQWMGNRKPFRHSQILSSRKLSSPAVDVKTRESFDTRLPMQSTKEFKLPSGKNLQTNQIQTPPDTRISHGTTASRDPGNNVCFPEVPQSQISFLLELLKEAEYLPQSESEEEQTCEVAITLSELEKYLHLSQDEPTQTTSTSEHFKQPVFPPQCAREARMHDTASTSSDIKKYSHPSEVPTTKTTITSELFKELFKVRPLPFHPNVREEARISDTTTTTTTTTSTTTTSSDTDICLPLSQFRPTHATSNSEQLFKRVSTHQDVKKEARIYDSPITSSGTDHYVSFPEFQSSSFTELSKETESPPRCKRKEAWDCVIGTSGASVTPSLSDIRRERYVKRDRISVKERDLSDISEKLDEAESFYSSSSDSFLPSKYSSTFPIISHDNSCSLGTSSFQKQQSFEETICSTHLQQCEMKIQSSNGDTNSSINYLEQNVKYRQQSEGELQINQNKLISAMDYQENQEIAQHQQDSSGGLSDLGQKSLITDPMALDSPTQPVTDRKDNTSNQDAKPLDDVEEIIPSGDENTEIDHILDNNNNNKLVSEDVTLLDGDIKMEANQELKLKLSSESLSTRIEPEKEESQNPKGIGVTEPESKKMESFSESKSVKTPTKYLRDNEAKKWMLNNNLPIYSTEPNTPASIYSFSQPPSTRPSPLSVNSKQTFRSTSLYQNGKNSPTLSTVKTEINQPSFSKSDENRSQPFIATRDRQISPFLRYNKPKCLLDRCPSAIIKRNSRLHRLPLKTHRMVDDVKKNFLTRRDMPITSVTNRFLRNPVARLFATGHLIPSKKSNSKTSYPTSCMIQRNRNANILMGKKIPTQIPVRETTISIPVKSEEQLNAPANTEVTSKPQEPPNKEDGSMKGTVPHNEEVESSATEKSRTKTSQTRISVRDIKDDDGLSTLNSTSDVLYALLNTSKNKCSSVSEFWKTNVLPTYIHRVLSKAHKCSSLSELDRKSSQQNPVGKSKRSNQSFNSSESSQFHTPRHFSENDLSKNSERRRFSMNLMLKKSHKFGCPTTVTSLDGSTHNIHKNANKSYPSDTSRGKKMSSEERMALRRRTQESIRIWLSKRQGNTSLKVKQNSCDSNKKMTSCDFSHSQNRSQETPIIQVSSHNESIDGKHISNENNRTEEVMNFKSGGAQKSRSSPIFEIISSVNDKQFLTKTLEEEKLNNNTQFSMERPEDRIKDNKTSVLSEVLRRSKSSFFPSNNQNLSEEIQKVECEDGDVIQESVLNSCRGNNSEDHSRFIQKQMENKGAQCEPYIHSHVSNRATVGAHVSQESTSSDKARQRIQRKLSRTRYYLKHHNQSPLKTLVPVSRLNLPVQPQYSMIGCMPDGSLIFRRVDPTPKPESQTLGSKENTQMNSSTPQEHHPEVTQCSSRRGGVFLPRPLPPANHVRGLKRPVTRSSSNFDDLILQCNDLVDAAKDFHKQATSSQSLDNSSKRKDGSRIIFSKSREVNRSISEAYKNAAYENKKHQDFNTMTNLGKYERREIKENNLQNYDPPENCRNEFCQTESELTFRTLCIPYESQKRDTKDKAVDCENLAIKGERFSLDQCRKRSRRNLFQCVNQVQSPQRCPMSQKFGHIRSIPNNFREWEVIDEVSSGQENNVSDRSKRYESKSQRSVHENRIPTRKVHHNRTTSNSQERYSRSYQERKKGEVSIQSRSKGREAKKVEWSDDRSNGKCTKKEKSLPTDTLLLPQRAKGVSVSSFAEPTRKVGQRVPSKNRSHHSNVSSQSGTKTRTSFGSSSRSRKSQEGRRSGNVRFITSLNSKAKKIRVSNPNPPSYVQMKSSKGNYKNVLDHQRSASVYLHQLKSSNCKSRSSDQENVTWSSRGTQCVEVQPSGFVDNRVSKVSYTIFKERPEQNENKRWDDSITQREYLEKSHQKRTSKDVTTLFQKFYTKTQSEMYYKDIANKSDKHRRSRDRTPSY